MKQIRLKAYAKVNLFLRVLGLDKRGRHGMDSFKCSVGLADEIDIAIRGDRRVSIRMDLAIDAKNNAEAAAEGLIKKFGLPGVDILIKKGIPLAAGLGGSSAAAAAVIYGLKKLFGLPDFDCSVYGDDVPFMLTGGVCFDGQRADEAKKNAVLDALSGYSLLIVKPFGGLITKDVFCRYDGLGLFKPKERGDSPDIAGLCRGILERDYQKIRANVYNDLYKAALSLRPDIERVERDILEEGAVAAVMSGSGNAFVGLFETDKSAGLAEASLTRKGIYESVTVCGVRPAGIETVG
ncbi:MAG: hypothetical protein LBQ40_07325 [Clostridiales bacterium]|jgi:4-diphosphocytidyl-2C-methyl-D-erythritol kinase|nr:hypothetical protein [Clostridiales bacterium]